VAAVKGSRGRSRQRERREYYEEQPPHQSHSQVPKYGPPTQWQLQHRVPPTPVYEKQREAAPGVEHISPIQ